MSKALLNYQQDPSLALLTDLYQVTMSYGYWKAGLDRTEAVFHLFFRHCPFNGGFTVTAGLQAVVEYLENFRFDGSDLEYLSTLKGAGDLPLFDQDFFEYLAQLRFSCDVDAIPEGNVAFPYEPMIRVQGPLIQCQLLESPLLNLTNFPSLIATKAARVCLAAQGDPVLEFGLRRAQGIDGSLTASRAAYIGGCESSSSILAGKLFGIPVRGTHSHSWVMVFDDELESFQCYAAHQPNNCIFLVDTYDTIEGVKKAIEVGKRLRQNGKQLIGIRLDSGDLTYLSIKARQLLDEAGFLDAKIVASNELDETIISELKRQGAKIDIWGVGTKLVTGGDHPALDGVYKLSAVRGQKKEWKYKLKLSEQMVKVSNPGILQVRRFAQNGEYIADAIYDVHHGMAGDCTIIDPFDATRQKELKGDLEHRDLLVPIFREGKRVYSLPGLEDIRRTTAHELGRFHTGVKRFIHPHQYIVGMEKSLYDMKVNLIKNIRKRNAPAYIIPNDQKRANHS
jgi:nicotinate phosphoribosyltransferase